MLELVHDVFERVDVRLRLGLEAEHDVAVHLHKTAIAVPGEALVAGLFDQATERRLVEADIEDGVHHAGHADAGAGAAGDKERILGVAELRAHRRFGLAQCILDLLLQFRRILVVVREVIIADFRAEGEPRRHRQVDIRHLGEVGPLTAEQILHVGPALGHARAKKVDILCRHTHLAL